MQKIGRHGGEGWCCCYGCCCCCCAAALWRGTTKNSMGGYALDWTTPLGSKPRFFIIRSFHHPQQRLSRRQAVRLCESRVQALNPAPKDKTQSLPLPPARLVPRKAFRTGIPESPRISRLNAKLYFRASKREKVKRRRRPSQRPTYFRNPPRTARQHGARSSSSPIPFSGEAVP